MTRSVSLFITFLRTFLAVRENFSRTFFPDLSMKILNFSKTGCTIFFKILHSHSTPKIVPAWTMASKSHDWDLRKITKIGPKMTEKWPFLDFHQFSQKLSI